MCYETLQRQIRNTKVNVSCWFLITDEDTGYTESRKLSLGKQSMSSIVIETERVLKYLLSELINTQKGQNLQSDV